MQKSLVKRIEDCIEEDKKEKHSILADETEKAFEDPAKLGVKLAADLLESKRVSAANYAAGVAALGEVGVVELVSIVGYYSFVALTMNTFEISDPQLPEGVNARAPWEADAALAE